MKIELSSESIFFPSDSLSENLLWVACAFKCMSSAFASMGGVDNAVLEATVKEQSELIASLRQQVSDLSKLFGKNGLPLNLNNTTRDHVIHH